MTDQTDLIPIIDQTSLLDVYNELDRYIAQNALILGDKIAGMDGEALYYAIHRSQALKQLKDDDRERIENKSLHVWSLEVSQKINSTNERFSKWFLPCLGMVSLVLMVAFFIPDRQQEEVKENGSAIAKVKYTDWNK